MRLFPRADPASGPPDSTEHLVPKYLFQHYMERRSVGKPRGCASVRRTSSQPTFDPFQIVLDECAHILVAQRHAERFLHHQSLWAASSSALRLTRFPAFTLCAVPVTLGLYS